MFAIFLIGQLFLTIHGHGLPLWPKVDGPLLEKNDPPQSKENKAPNEKFKEQEIGPREEKPWSIYLAHIP